MNIDREVMMLKRHAIFWLWVWNTTKLAFAGVLLYDLVRVSVWAFDHFFTR